MVFHSQLAAKPSHGLDVFLEQCQMDVRSVLSVSECNVNNYSSGVVGPIPEPDRTTVRSPPVPVIEKELYSAGGLRVPTAAHRQ